MGEAVSATCREEGRPLLRKKRAHISSHQPTNGRTNPQYSAPAPSTRPIPHSRPAAPVRYLSRHAHAPVVYERPSTSSHTGIPAASPPRRILPFGIPYARGVPGGPVGVGNDVAGVRVAREGVVRSFRTVYSWRNRARNPGRQHIEARIAGKEGIPLHPLDRIRYAVATAEDTPPQTPAAQTRDLGYD